jgi:hypothetical protein
VHYVRAFFAFWYDFWYDFLVGDDWRIAAGVVLTLLITAGVANAVSRPLGTVLLLGGVLLTAAYVLSRSVRGEA